MTLLGLGGSISTARTAQSLHGFGLKSGTLQQPRASHFASSKEQPGHQSIKALSPLETAWPCRRADSPDRRLGFGVCSFGISGAQGLKESQQALEWDYRQGRRVSGLRMVTHRDRDGKFTSWLKETKHGFGAHTRTIQARHMVRGQLSETELIWE